MQPLLWKTLPGHIPYTRAIAYLTQVGKRIAQGTHADCIFALETKPVYTRGRTAEDWALHNPDKYPIYDEDRGGSYTYYGPGIRLYAPMLHLKNRKIHFSHFQDMLIAWMLKALTSLGIPAYNREKWLGAWVHVSKNKPQTAGEAFLRIDKSSMTPQDFETYLEAHRTEYKIGALGFYIENWVSHLGLAINYAANMADFEAIRSCSLPTYYGITSLEKLGYNLSPTTLDQAFRDNAHDAFSL